jgi:hypothetical protein
MRRNYFLPNEGTLGVMGHSSSQQRFPGARRPVQQHPFKKADMYRTVLTMSQ